MHFHILLPIVTAILAALPAAAQDFDTQLIDILGEVDDATKIAVTRAGTPGSLPEDLPAAAANSLSKISSMTSELASVMPDPSVERVTDAGQSQVCSKFETLAQDYKALADVAIISINLPSKEEDEATYFTGVFTEFKNSVDELGFVIAGFVPTCAAAVTDGINAVDELLEPYVSTTD